MGNLPHEDERLVELVNIQGEMEADILTGILESEGIRVLKKSNMAHGALPFTVDGMGEVKLCVMEEDVTMARIVIKEYLENR